MRLSSRMLSTSLLVAAAVAAAACGSEIGKPPEGTVFVAIKDNFFEPQTTTVPVGRSVRWTNEGAAAHTVVQVDLLWQSNVLHPNSWFEVRFEETGTFEYRCGVHDDTGTVVVQ